MKGASRLMALLLGLLAPPAFGQLANTGVHKLDGSDSGGSGSGDVESIDMTLPSILALTAPCASGACVLELTLATQVANRVWAGPASGGAAVPTFRALVSLDIPNNAANTSGNAGTATALAANPADCSAGQYASSINASGTLGCAQVAYSQVSSTPAIGTDVQAFDADLALLAAVSPTTKGDILVYNGSAWVRLPAGTDTHVLTVDSAQAAGVKYAAPSGGLSGLTATKLPVATSSSAIGNSAITHDSTTGVTTLGGSGPKLGFGSDLLIKWDGAYPGAVFRNAADSAFVRVVGDGMHSLSWVLGTTYVKAGDAFYAPTAAQDGTYYGARIKAGGGWWISSTSDATGTPSKGYREHGIQVSNSKALVDATATAFAQVDVASNGYEGGTVHYTIYATDGTDRQARSGLVSVAIVNQGGTESCVFGTAVDSVNPTTGTLTVAFDCSNSPTNGVLLRANADTSLTPSTFTIEYRIDLTSGLATVTPQ